MTDGCNVSIHVIKVSVPAVAKQGTVGMFLIFLILELLTPTSSNVSNEKCKEYSDMVQFATMWATANCVMALHTLTDRAS